MADRLLIEDIIFWLAAQHHCAICSYKGELHAPRAEGLLKDLIDVYNEAFAKENIRHVAEDITSTCQAEEARYRYFLQEQANHPLAASFHLIKKHPAV